MKFHCHCNIPEYTKLLNIFNFLIGMFMYNLNFKLYMNIPMRKLKILSNVVYSGILQ